ncbi:MAG: ATP cone domain-containing protein [Kiritimatiellae bacterium]|nr:ATP cone domain-containing protein [Kiritimatiellia bacterium]
MQKEFPIRNIVKRNGTIVRYDRERITTAILKALTAEGRPDRRLADNLAAKVEAALGKTYGPESLPTVEDIQDVVENVLMENHLPQVARRYIIYRHQRAMVRAAKEQQFEVTDWVPYKKIYEVLLWNMDHGCDSVPNLNRLVARGEFPDLVRAAEERYHEEVRQACERIMAGLGRFRIVIVAGPSSSGKTTTMLKIGEHLRKVGVELQSLNIDNYYFDLERHPRDEFGDYDYEQPEALDLDLINEHLEQLLEGRTVRTPHYDFKTGRRTLNVHEVSLGRNQLLLIDSLHGLYDRMTGRIPSERKFKLYVETLGQFRGADGTFMRWADNRLLRRMIRDKHHRNLKPMETLTHWHYVRRSELRNIIPFIKTTDFILNSALPYELPILKPRVMRYISRAVQVFRNDAQRLDAYIRASRIHKLLKPLRSVRNDDCIPRDSLLREFIGGSSYEY